MHSRLCVRCRCALCAGVRTGTTFPPPVAVPVPAWSSRRGQCVCPLLVFDCETLVPQLNRRRSLGPRRFSVLAGGLWNRNDGARGGHTPRHCATHRPPDPPDPRTPRSCHCHSLFLLRLCGDGSFFFSSRRGGPRRRLRGCWLTRTTAHGAQSRTRAQVAPTDEGAPGRGPLVEPCADVPRDVARPAPPDLDLKLK